MMRRRILASALILLLAPAVLAALAAPAAPPASPAAAPGTHDPPSAGPLLVFAAASLTTALNDIGPLYARRSGERVAFSFAASSTLARQITAGAQANVFFSADTDWMDFLEGAASSTRRRGATSSATGSR